MGSNLVKCFQFADLYLSVPTFLKILNEVFGILKMWMVYVIEEIVERSKCSVVASLCFFVYSAIPEHRC